MQWVTMQKNINFMHKIMYVRRDIKERIIQKTYFGNNKKAQMMICTFSINNRLII
ncbi:hypothetical protein XBJ2_1260009 [Xenorhabdus bovienii str. Jollieti]|uniref:Uncharacterized protein n=1 Tax=Xenorhabdus bovienii (strain SS-2004) TaxID=406818 RepID=D3V1E1_XENBS|nr:hypothetical protein XBJ1_2359 [Xenorhabdus bovienii SS-2004]CDH27264.1 hypothetical protein XBJ2_1260009 [Xenorhabdus bovienii str. Jollieti]